MANSISLVGLDVHAAQTHAAVSILRLVSCAAGG